MSPAETSSLEERARYRRVIRGAEELFKRNGFKGVTMEAVAREAAVSKVTVYSYFKNKDELFIVVAERMAELMRRAVLNELAAEALPLDDRLANAVLAKLKLVAVNVRGSAHAEDLFSQTDRLAGEAFERMEADLMAALTAAICEDEALAPKAGSLALALLYGGGAVGKFAVGLDDLERETRAFVAIHLAGARALAVQREKPDEQ